MPGSRCTGSLLMGFIAGALAGAAGGLLLAARLGRTNSGITRDQQGRYRDRSGRYVTKPNNSNPGRNAPEGPGS
jgi:gas vesicle protein